MLEQWQRMGPAWERYVAPVERFRHWGIPEVLLRGSRRHCRRRTQSLKVVAGKGSRRRCDGGRCCRIVQRSRILAVLVTSERAARMDHKVQPANTENDG